MGQSAKRLHIGGCWHTVLLIFVGPTTKSFAMTYDDLQGSTRDKEIRKKEKKRKIHQQARRATTKQEVQVTPGGVTPLCRTVSCANEGY